jgi:hypothetical protein
VSSVCPCPTELTDFGDGQGCLACRSDLDCPVSKVCVAYACAAGACLRTKTVGDDGQGRCTTKTCDPTTGYVHTANACAETRETGARWTQVTNPTDATGGRDRPERGERIKVGAIGLGVRSN